MKLIMICIIMSIALGASVTFPKFYSSMGSPLYENAQGFQVLMQSKYFKYEYAQIDKYVMLSNVTEAFGYQIDLKSTSAQRIEYMNELRVLKNKNDALWARLLPRLELLFKQKRYQYLASLHDNKARDIRELRVVKSSFSLALGEEELSEQDAKFVSIQTSFNRYKEQLLKARMDQNATTCLNDMTALYHYFLEMESMRDQKKCHQFDESYKQMKIYLHAISLSCSFDDADITKAKKTSVLYDTEACQ